MMNELRRRYVVKANGLCTATICVFLGTPFLCAMIMGLLPKCLSGATCLMIIEILLCVMSFACILFPIAALILRLYARKYRAAEDMNFGIVRTVIACGILLFQMLYWLNILFTVVRYSVA